MARYILACMLAACLVACSMAAFDNVEPSRRLLQSGCSLKNAVFKGDEPASWKACPKNTAAWCCASDDLVSAKTCKAADPKAGCSGKAFTYMKADDGQMKPETLNEVWCVPTNCKAAFDAKVAAQLD